MKVYIAFSSTPKINLEHIRDKLQKAINGPINAIEETPKTTTARNFLFEASLAARAHRPNQNINAILDAPSDTGVKVGNTKLWVECKRVTSTSKIETNVRKASKQLEAIFKKQQGSGHRGIIALDITKILNVDDKIFISNSDNQLLLSIDQMMNDFIRNYSHTWQQVYQKRSNKIIGTVVRFAFMAKSESRNILVYAAQWGLNPKLGITKSDELVLKQLVSSLNN